MRYIDYKAMKDFYIIAEVCELFEVNMQKLRQYSEQYDVQPQQDKWADGDFPRCMFANSIMRFTRQSAAAVKTR